MSKEGAKSATDEEFVKVFNDTNNYPTIADVAVALGLSPQTIRNRASLYRKKAALDPRLPKLIDRSAVRPEVPMSEDPARFMEEWGPEECIAELRRIASLEPDKVITRNYFRVHSNISESTWNRYFGTFEEFKRQAGIKLTRQQHALERDIAKHASVDHYRKIGAERADWGEKYVRENGARFKTILVASDLHDREIDPFFLRVFLDTAKRAQPDVICLAGDVFDLAEFGKYTVDPREWDVVGRIKFVHEQILKPLRENCPNAQIDHIEGNHEARLLRMLADATPALRTLLADLHGFTVSKLFGLEQFEVNYVARADLGAFTLGGLEKEIGKNYKIYWKAFLAHHFPHGREMGLPGVNGHHHKHVVWPMYSPIFGPYEWHQLGCGHRRVASYCEGEKWHMGFALVNIDIETKASVFDYIQVTDFAVVGGKWYYRQEAEYTGAPLPLFSNVSQS